MTDRIFETYAPQYWRSGLPVIPLRHKNKMPDINNWSLYGRQMPSETEQMGWLTAFPRGNIGLPLGPASGICIIDIDTEDLVLDAAIREICGPTPWVRVGKKGAALAYRWEGQKNFKLRGAEGGMICEFLGLGNQVVVPPSIHPDTQMPYTANANLWEVMDKLPTLGEDIEDKLRALLGDKGFAIGAGGRSSPIDIVPAGERDVQMVRHAGYLANVVLGIDRSAKFSLMNAMAHMHHWAETYTAKVSGDAIDPEKGVLKLLEFLIKDLAKGRTMPDGWDAEMTDDVRAHPMICEIADANEARTWTLQSACDWLDERLHEKPGDLNWMAISVGEIIQAVSNDAHFSDVYLLPLFHHIKRRCYKALGLGIPDLKGMYTRAKAGLVAEEAEDHSSIAHKVLDQLTRFGEIRYDHGQFWQWHGAHFAKLDEAKIYLHVANHVKDCALVRRNSDYKAIVEVLERICLRPLVESENRGINFANGFVSENLSVVAHEPKYGATFTLPFEYHPENATRCSKWLDFLYSCWGEEPDFGERVDALQEMFAVTLFKIAPQYQRAFLLFGRASTGKTQILKVLRAMLPPAAVAELGPQHWGERFALTDLIGKAVNICGELPENGMISGSIFKGVIEGSPCRTEFKNQDGFVFVPECANWFASNYLPASRDSTNGFSRRWLILDFNKPIPEGKRIENLAEKLVAEEREAIAAWALAGLARARRQLGFTLPTSHQRRVHQMRRINNTVQVFLDDNSLYEQQPDGVVKAQELYRAYDFHIRHVIHGSPVNFERFMQMMEDLHFDTDRDIIGDPLIRGLVKRDVEAAL